MGRGYLSMGGSWNLVSLGGVGFSALGCKFWNPTVGLGFFYFMFRHDGPFIVFVNIFRDKNTVTSIATKPSLAYTLVGWTVLRTFLDLRQQHSAMIRPEFHTIIIQWIDWQTVIVSPSCESAGSIPPSRRRCRCRHHLPHRLCTQHPFPHRRRWSRPLPRGCRPGRTWSGLSGLGAGCSPGGGANCRTEDHAERGRCTWSFCWSPLCRPSPPYACPSGCRRSSSGWCCRGGGSLPPQWACLPPSSPGFLYLKISKSKGKVKNRKNRDFRIDVHIKPVSVWL